MEEDLGKENCEGRCFIKKFLFGKISRKLIFGFGIILILMSIMIILTYNLNKSIAEDTLAIKEVEAPLELIVEQVISYDAILTGNAHWALLYALRGNMDEVKKHQQKYGETGVLLDDLIKFRSRELLSKSERPKDLKNKVYFFLEELDQNYEPESPWVTSFIVDLI